VQITVTANAAADRVVYQFGDLSYGLKIEDAMVLANHTLAAIEMLRPPVAPGVVQ
jgi:hypothetical protein